MFSIISGLIILFVAASAAYGAEKVDPFLGVFPAASHATHDAGQVKAMVVSGPGYDVFIKSNDVESTRVAVESAGGTVKIVSGNIITAFISPAQVEAIAQRGEVVFIEAAKPISTQNNLAMTDINGNEVHEGVEIPSALTGKNVIVGMIDTGIDYSHPDFNDASGNSRILFIWDQMSDSGTPPSEIETPYGTECNADDLSRHNCPVVDTSGHGTHITGTAAGRNDTYGGVAPDASIIVVRYKAELEFTNGLANTVFSTTICEGAYYVFKKAEEMGLPAVVNLSLGTQIGAHDGTSLFEECLDNLVAGSKGRAIIVAAGNENSEEEDYTGLHAGYDVSGDSATNFAVRSFVSGRTIYLDIWGSRGSNLNFGIRANRIKQTPQNSGTVRPGESKGGRLFGGDVSYEMNAEETESPLNGKPHVGIVITLSSRVSTPGLYNFDLLVSGKGHFDAWLYPDKPATAVNFTNTSGTQGGLNFVPGDRAMSIAVPATAKNVIGVAAYTTRNKWEAGTGCCQVNYMVGDLVEFSSRGPSADPSVTGQKPEIAAPGAMIASAKSHEASADSLLVMSDGMHMLMAGTSMAAPFVAGTVALLFEANPNYTFEDVERYLTQSAYVDTFTGSVPNESWGYGKLDVLATVEAAIGGGASGSSTDNASLSADESAGKAGSCELVVANTSGCGSAILIMIVLTLNVLLVRRQIS